MPYVQSTYCYVASTLQNIKISAGNLLKQPIHAYSYLCLFVQLMQVVQNGHVVGHGILPAYCVTA